MNRKVVGADVGHRPLQMLYAQRRNSRAASNFADKLQENVSFGEAKKGMPQMQISASVLALTDVSPITKQRPDGSPGAADFILRIRLLSFRG